MVAVLSWIGLITPVVVVLFRELAALWRQHTRRTDIARIVRSVWDKRSVRIVDIDSDGALIDVTVLGDNSPAGETSTGTEPPCP